MSKLQHTITLHPAQSQIFQNNARFKVIRCGRRFGKSYFAITTLLARAGEHPGDYWFISPTYRQSKEIAWKLLVELAPGGWIVSKNETELSVQLKNGAVIKLKGADNEDSLRGVGLQGVVLDEYAFIKPNVWQEIVRPMLFDSGGWAIFISTPNGYNHFFELWEQAAPKPGGQWDRFHFTSYDNPHIPADELDDAKRTMSLERFGQEIMAEFTKKTGAIWPVFNRDIHVVPQRPYNPDCVHNLGIDFGFAIGHPTAVAIFEWDNQGDIFLADGFMEPGLNVERIGEQIRNRTTGLLVRDAYCDSARPDLIEELLNAKVPAIKADKDVELGIAKVDEMFQVNPLTKKPRLTIASHLTDFIRQIENYEWEQVRTEDGYFKQVPRKRDDDACDAIRYCVYSHTFIPQTDAITYGQNKEPVTGYRPYGAHRGYHRR